MGAWSKLGLIAMVMLLCACGSATPAPLPTAPSGTATVASGASDFGREELSTEELRSISRLRVFFAHRSVGADIVVDGIPAVFQKHGLHAPTVNDGIPLAEGSLGDRWLDQTDDPQTKLDDFQSWVRHKGVGQASDVVFMKLGYVDVNERTDVDALFESYRSMMEGLERDFPSVTFLHATVSVTQWVIADNVAFERFNSMMRAEYGQTGRLFDLARVLSTRPDGTRVQGTTDEGEVYYQLFDGFTRDGGHLSQAGSEAAATELLRVIAASTR